MARKQELVTLLKESVNHAEKSGKVRRVDLLEMLDKSPSTFNLELREWKDDDCRNKLGFEDAWTLIKVCNAVPVLSYMAAELGHTISPMSGSAPDGLDMTHECFQGYRATSNYLNAAEGGASYQELIAALPGVIKELEDVARRARMEQVVGKTRPVQIRKAG